MLYLDIYDCYPDPCQKYGTCVDGVNSYINYQQLKKYSHEQNNISYLLYVHCTIFRHQLLLS